MRKLILNLIIICFFGLVFLYTLGFLNYKFKVIEYPIKDAMTDIQNSNNYVELEDISTDFIDAIITIEDQRFYTRYGIDLYSIARAFLNGLEKGDFNEGGSTITQQLSKNIYFSFEQTILRKVSEIFMTYSFETLYSKDDILESYVNYIYYGDGYYGIYEASLGYFDKLPSELNLAEATMLAGLPQSPSYYQLSTGYDLAKVRQIEVLEALLAEGIINQKEFETALIEDLR